MFVPKASTEADASLDSEWNADKSGVSKTTSNTQAAPKATPEDAGSFVEGLSLGLLLGLYLGLLSRLPASLTTPEASAENNKSALPDYVPRTEHAEGPVSDSSEVGADAVRRVAEELAVEAEAGGDSDYVRRICMNFLCGKLEPSPYSFRACEKCLAQKMEFPKHYCRPECQKSDWHLQHSEYHQAELVNHQSVLISESTFQQRALWIMEYRLR